MKQIRNFMIGDLGVLPRQLSTSFLWKKYPLLGKGSTALYY